MSGLRIVFMGTPAFALVVLRTVERLADRLGGELVRVYTAPDKPAGRGRRPQESPVREYAEARGLTVVTPRRLGGADESARFEALGADLIVLAAYGLLLPGPFLYRPAHGALNVHPSLLPRHRGASPVAAAILAGDRESGTTLMRMDEGLDTGPVLAQERVPLRGDERTPSLTARLFGLGAELLEEWLPPYVAGQASTVPQAEEGVTVSRRLTKEDSRIDWTRPAEELDRQVRAFDPWPGTATSWEGMQLEVLESVPRDESAAGGPLSAGTVVHLGRGVGVACGQGVLELTKVRLQGRNAVTGEEFVRGRPRFPGSRLPS